MIWYLIRFCLEYRIYRTLDATGPTDIRLTGSFPLVGSVTAASLDLRAAGLILTGILSDGGAGTTRLTSTGAIAASGSLIAGTLTGSASLDASFTGSNGVANIGNFTAGGNFVLNDAAPTLGIAGTVSGSSVILTNPGGIVFAAGARISAPLGTVQLDAASGSINASLGTIDAGTLSGSAVSALFTGLNHVASLGSFAVGSGLVLFDAQPLGVTGAVSAATVSLVTDALALSPGGTITAATFELAPLTPGGAMTLGGAGSSLASLAGISASSYRLGAVSPPGAGSPRAGSISVVAAFDAQNHPLELDAIGTIQNAGGALVNVATLTGQAASVALANPANSIANLGTFTAGSFLLNNAAVTNRDEERIEVDDRVDGFERPRLPNLGVLEHRLGDLANELRRDLRAVKLLEVALDLPRRHAARVEREEFLIEAIESPNIFGDDARGEAAVAVARDTDGHRPGLRFDLLLGVAIAGVLPPPVARLLPFFKAEMTIHLRLEHLVDERLLEMLKEPLGPP